MILDNTFVPTHDPRWYFEPLLSLSFPLSCNCLVTYGERGIPLWAEMTRIVSSLPKYGGLDSDSDTYSLRILKFAKNVESDLRFTSKGHPSDHHTLTILSQKQKKPKEKYWSLLSAPSCWYHVSLSSINQSVHWTEGILTQNLHCAYCAYSFLNVFWWGKLGCHFVLYPSRGGH